MPMPLTEACMPRISHHREKILPTDLDEPFMVARFEINLLLFTQAVIEHRP